MDLNDSLKSRTEHPSYIRMPKIKVNYILTIKYTHATPVHQCKFEIKLASIVQILKFPISE